MLDIFESLEICLLLKAGNWGEWGEGGDNGGKKDLLKLTSDLAVASKLCSKGAITMLLFCGVTHTHTELFKHFPEKMKMFPDGSSGCVVTSSWLY